MVLSRENRNKLALEAAEIHLHSNWQALNRVRGRMKDQEEKIVQYESENPDDHASDKYKSLWRDFLETCMRCEEAERAFNEMENLVEGLKKLVETEEDV